MYTSGSPVKYTKTESVADNYDFKRGEIMVIRQHSFQYTYWLTQIPPSDAEFVKDYIAEITSKGGKVQYIKVSHVQTG